MIEQAFADAGLNYFANRSGANLISGITAEFAMHSTLTGRPKCQFAVIECDEAASKTVLKYLKPEVIVATNVFRDQLDRYGEIDITIKLLTEAFDKLGKVNLILNGDDPLCTYFGTKYNAVYYGVDEKTNVETNEIKEGRFCLVCGEELKYNYYHYSQLGDYYCEKCGFKRPKLDYSAKNVDLDGIMKFDINFGGKTLPVSVDYKGFYNIYNILAAFSAFASLNLGFGNIGKTLAEYKPQIGRMESFNIGGKKVILNLSKNPAGFNQAIATLNADPEEKDVFAVINDNAQDGRDISWIWDVDFELMAKSNIKSLTAGGIRRDDVAVRFKYADLKDFDVLENNIKNLAEIIGRSKRTLYVLVNYTALFSTQTNLLKLEKEEEK